VELRRQMQVGVFALVVTLGGGVWGYFAQNSAIEERRNELTRVEAEVKRLEGVIKEVQQFETRKALMEKKVGAIEDIKLKQRRPARFLDEISASLPEQMWLVSVKDAGGGIQISGRSFDNVGIAAFMENLERAPSFRTVELVESKAEILQGRSIVTFTVVARLGVDKKKEETS
jgi:Tfp pilus assembly protein PilN